MLLIFIPKAQCQECITPPSSYEFKSTSQKPRSEYTIPFAAKDINIYNNNPSSSIRRGRGIDDDGERPGYNPSDPGMTPIGDEIQIMTFFAILYLIMKIKHDELTKKTS